MPVLTLGDNGRLATLALGTGLGDVVQLRKEGLAPAATYPTMFHTDDLNIYIDLYDETNSVYLTQAAVDNYDPAADGSGFFDLSDFQAAMDYYIVYRMTLWTHALSSASADLYFMFVPQITFEKIFGPSVNYDTINEELIIRIRELGYPVSNIELDGSNIGTPANVDACGLVLGILQRVIEKQGDNGWYWPIKVNISALATANPLQTQIEVVDGRRMHREKYVVTVDIRANEPITLT